MTKHSRSCSFLLPTGSEAPQDALLSTESIEVRPAELHSRSAEENCSTENVSSLRSVKVATPPLAPLMRLPPVYLPSADGFENRSPPASCKKSMMEVLNLKRAAKIVLIGVCFGLILLFLKIIFRIDDAAFMHGYMLKLIQA